MFQIDADHCEALLESSAIHSTGGRPARRTPKLTHTGDAVGTDGVHEAADS